MTVEPGDLVLAALACAGVACVCLVGFLITGTAALTTAIRQARRVREQP
jgi:glutamate-1-semialdehyde aminotransferase